MDTAKAELAASKKKAPSKDAEEQGPAKKKQKKSTVATGLKSNWQQHLANKGPQESDSSNEGSMMGGLNDNDMKDSPPKVAPKHIARANNVYCLS